MLPLYKTTRNLKLATRASQGTTSNFEAMAVDSRLFFLLSKTVVMVFRKRKERNKEPLEIMLRNQIIPYMESTQIPTEDLKYLTLYKRKT